jgi:alcohol dehydrogenase
MGSRCGSYKDFEKAVELLKLGAVRPIITRVARGLEGTKNALEHALKPEEVKVVMRVAD